MMKYDKYKESGIEWLGKIPEHWEVNRLKNIFSFGKGLSITKKNLRDIGIPCVSYGEIHSKYGFEVIPEIHYLKCVEENYLLSSKKSLLDRGDFVFADTSEDIEGSGNFTYLNSQIRVFAGYHTIVAKSKINFNSRYVAYLFDSIGYRTQIQKKVTGVKVFSITQSLLKGLNIYFPPLPEQQAIVTYLDKKIQAMDKKVSLLEQKTSYYKELRKSLINTTVTKGLDPNVPLKDSGIDWIGQIPKHWEVKRVKDIGYLYSGLSGKSGDDFRQENSAKNKAYIPFTNIAGNTYISKYNLGEVIIESNELQNKVKKGDIFFLMSSEGYEDIGKSSVLNVNLEETYLNSFCKGFRLKDYQNSPYFINYVLLSDSYRHLLIVEGKGFTRINLKMEKVKDLFVFLPPTLNEQTAIANYLDEKTKKIDAIISNIEQQIEKAKELRKTLINNVVTGKIKVVQ